MSLIMFNIDLTLATPGIQLYIHLKLYELINVQTSFFVDVQVS